MSHSEHETSAGVGSTKFSCPLTKAKLAVRVIRKDLRQPVGGADVSLSGPTTVRQTTSTAAGLAQFDSLEPGAYTIDVTLPDSLKALFKGDFRLQQTLEAQDEAIRTIELEARVLLKLRLLRGTGKRTGRCKVLLLSTEDDEAGTELATAGPYEIEKGRVHVLASVEVAAQAKFARLYFVDEAGNETGEGLSLKIDAAPAITNPNVSAQALRALGFHEKEPFTGEEPTPAQQLELDLALARYQRTLGEAVKPFDPDVLETFEEKYLEYRHAPRSLPSIDFPDIAPATTTVDVRLGWFRADNKRSGRFRAVVDSDDFCTELYRIDPRSFSNGSLSFEVPAWVARSAKAARIYLLNGNNEETGEGLYWIIGPAGNITEAPTASQVLRALGFNDKEPVTGVVLTEAQRLESELALARYQRSLGDTVSAADQTLLRSLESAYLEYSPRPTSLPRLAFPDSDVPRETTGIRLRWVRGRQPREGRCYVILDSDEFGTELYQSDPVSISKGNIDLKVPKWVTNAAKVCRVYVVDGRNQPTGEGLYLTIRAKPDMLTGPDVSRTLRALGFHEKEPLRGEPTAAQTLDLDLALARCQQALGDPITSFDSENAEPLRQLEAEYLEYQNLGVS